MKKRNLNMLSSVVLALVPLVGCSSNTYKPNAADTALSAYAGQAVYPEKMQAEMSPHLFATVAPDSTITLYNAADTPLSSFELWVNKTYTLHVEKMEAKTALPFDAGTLYNKTGMNLKTIPSNQIAEIQILSQDKLWDVQGPIMPH